MLITNFPCTFFFSFKTLGDPDSLLPSCDRRPNALRKNLWSLELPTLGARVFFFLLYSWWLLTVQCKASNNAKSAEKKPLATRVTSVSEDFFLPYSSNAWSAFNSLCSRQGFFYVVLSFDLVPAVCAAVSPLICTQNYWERFNPLPPYHHHHHH